MIFGVHVIYLALVGLSLALAGGLAALAPAALQPWPLLAVPPLAYAILAGLMRVTRGKPLYVSHLVDDTAFTHAYAAGQAPEVAPRLDAFAARIRAAEGEADEVVVGHSSSSFLGIEVLDRVLARDPSFGSRGTPVTFLSIGSVIPWLGLDPARRGSATRSCASGARSRSAGSTCARPGIGCRSTRATRWPPARSRRPSPGARPCSG